MTEVRPFVEIARIECDPSSARVYEHGWQSWSPSTEYALDELPHRPAGDRARVLGYRPDRRAPAQVFQGEGLLAVEASAGGPVHVFAARPGDPAVPSIRARVEGDAVVVGGPGLAIEQVVDHGGGGIAGALGRWADDWASDAGVGPIRPAPTMWCSWYQYHAEVREQDLLDNLDALDELELPVDVVQLDDGYQAGIGDWLATSERFRSLPDLVARIHDRGRRAGIWTAPFLVGADSRLHAEHPDWLVGEAEAGHNWDQELYALDVTRPEAAGYLREVFTTLRAHGFDLFKVDFLYAGALPGRRWSDLPAVEAYRRGLRLIREAIGPDAYLLGCGAPILSSVGLVDAMRVSPDTGTAYEPRDGDLSQPSQRAATLSGVGRAWQHGRFWVNDPDCLIARPQVERREDWAAHVERYGGLRASSDRLRDLDAWGLETTRQVLSTVPPPTPFRP